jgi:hypothetical protein
MSEPLPSETKLTRRQAAIIGAFTGVLCGPFEDMHAYVDSLPGFKGIMTVSLALQTQAIKQAAGADFLAMCPSRSDPHE